MDLCVGENTSAPLFPSISYLGRLLRREHPESRFRSLRALFGDREVALYRFGTELKRMRVAGLPGGDQLDLGSGAIELGVVRHDDRRVGGLRCRRHLPLRGDVDVEIRYSARKIECRSPE